MAFPLSSNNQLTSIQDDFGRCQVCSIARVYISSGGGRELLWTQTKPKANAFARGGHDSFEVDGPEVWGRGARSASNDGAASGVPLLRGNQSICTPSISCAVRVLGTSWHSPVCMYDTSEHCELELLPTHWVHFGPFPSFWVLTDAIGSLWSVSAHQWTLFHAHERTWRLMGRPKGATGR